MKQKHYISLIALGLASLTFTGCDTTGINTSGVVNMVATGGDRIVQTNVLPITTNEGYRMDYKVPIPQDFHLYDLTYAHAFARRYMELWNEDMAKAGADEKNFFDLENEHQMMFFPDRQRNGVERNFRRYNMYNVIKKDAQKYRDGNRRFWKFVGDQRTPKPSDGDQEWEYSR